MRPSPGTPPDYHLVARAPTRVDFGGGWTDVPPYPERDGGFVCNVAISRRAEVHVTPATGVCADDPLAAAALRHAGLAARVRIANEFPTGAGLGGSSAAGVALQAAIAALSGDRPSSEQLVQRSRAVEVEELGIAGGWQDHYASAFGGALGLEFGAATRVHRITLPDSCAVALASRCILLYTGESRISGANITAVLDAYAARVARVTVALARMATLAREMAEALGHGDIDALGALVREHWTHQRALHPAITTPRIDEIVARALAAGAFGAKALGASGGGCVVIVAPADPGVVRAAVAPLGTVLPFSVAPLGVTVEHAA